MNPLPPPGNMPPARPGWWQRNWKWFVPSGCLGMVLLAVIFIVSIFSLVAGAMKSSDAYKTALARARADSRVVSALGTPIEDGFFVAGQTNVSGSSGQADLSVSLSGPKGKGKLYFVASKFAGEWTFSKMMVKVEKTDEEIDLAPTVP